MSELSSRSSLNLCYQSSFYGLTPSVGIEPTGYIYVLGADGNLWTEPGSARLWDPGSWPAFPNPRGHVDSSVMAFHFLQGATAQADVLYVLGADGNLWLEHSDGVVVPPPRQHVDGSVIAFQGLDANTIYVLGTDGNLWLEHSVNGQFGQVPPPRTHIDGNVDDFQAIGTGAYVLGKDGNLWWEYGPFGQVPPPRIQIDGNVRMATVYGTIRPAFMIITLLYAPLGTAGSATAQSTVTYAEGSNTGTTTSASSSFKDAVDVKASVSEGLASASADFSASQTTTDTTSIQIQSTESYSYTVHGPSVDGIDHDYDLFYLWLNPVVSVAADRQKNVAWEFNGAGAVPVYVQVGQLKDPPTLPMGTSLKNGLDKAGLKQADYESILAMNPFASGATQVDTNRFVLLDVPLTYEYLQGSSGSTTVNLTSSKSTTKAHADSKAYSVSASVSGGGGLSDVINAKLTVTASFEWTNSNSESTTTGSTSSASAVIAQPSPSWSGSFHVLLYWDTFYNSFMFAFGD